MADDGLFAEPAPTNHARSSGDTRVVAAGSTVLDPTFAGRVAVLMRSRPIADAWAASGYQGIPDDTYDIATPCPCCH